MLYVLRGSSVTPVQHPNSEPPTERPHARIWPRRRADSPLLCVIYLCVCGCTEVGVFVYVLFILGAFLTLLCIESRVLLHKHIVSLLNPCNAYSPLRRSRIDQT